MIRDVRSERFAEAPSKAEQAVCPTEACAADWRLGR